jgi:hypothetical protein
MRKQLFAGLALVSIAAFGPAASADSLTSTVKRVYVSNTALALHFTSHPAGCPWGIIASDQDPAYDRWISLAMQAYASQTSVTIDYTLATCKLTSFAIGTP